MKTLTAISMVFAASSLAFGCAGAVVTSSNPASATRGAVVVHGQSVKAVVQGPTVIHAYAADRGGGLYAVPVVTGSDTDCGLGPPAGDQQATPIPRERMMVVTVEAGQMVCLATSKTRAFELLWHAYNEGKAHDQEGPQVLLAARSNTVK
jgi:hypothetical protein